MKVILYDFKTFVETLHCNVSTSNQQRPKLFFAWYPILKKIDFLGSLAWGIRPRDFVSHIPRYFMSLMNRKGRCSGIYDGLRLDILSRTCLARFFIPKAQLDI